MKIELLTIHSATSDWCESALKEYQKKISFFFPFEIRKLKGPKVERSGSDSKRKAESEILLKAIPPSDYVILLDERGKGLDSLAFAKKFGQLIDQSNKKIIFVIGGAYGVDEQVKKRAQMSLSLSTLTLNHWNAQIVMVEQIYRALTILKGIPYHNQ